MSTLKKAKSKANQTKSSNKKKYLKQEESDDYDALDMNYIEFPIIKQEPIVLQISDDIEQQQIAVASDPQKDGIEENENKFRVKRINGCFQMSDIVYFQVLIGTAKTTFRQPQILSFDQLNRGKHNKMLIYNYMIKLSLSNEEQCIQL